MQFSVPFFFLLFTVPFLYFLFFVSLSRSPSVSLFLCHGLSLCLSPFLCVPRCRQKHTHTHTHTRGKESSYVWYRNMKLRCRSWNVSAFSFLWKKLVPVRSVVRECTKRKYSLKDRFVCYSSTCYSLNSISVIKWPME